MKTLRIIKGVSVLVLLVTFTLPLSECHILCANGDETMMYSWNFLLAGVACLQYGWLAFLLIWVFLAFIWPLPFTILDILHGCRYSKVWILLIQMVLSIGSIASILLIRFGKLLFGAYLASSAFGVYFAMSLAELILLHVSSSRQHNKKLS
jgi:hypothetical protein